MATKFLNEDQKYKFLLKRIKEGLAQSYKNGSCSETELLAFLRVFQTVSDYWQLRVMIETFEEKFPFLTSMSSEVKEIQKSEMEVFLQRLLPQLMNKDPEKVVQITKFIASPGVTLADLMQKYNDLND